MPGRVAVHPQHPRYESASYHSGDSAQQERALRSLNRLRSLLLGLSWTFHRGRIANFRRAPSNRKIYDSSAYRSTSRHPIFTLRSVISRFQSLSKAPNYIWIFVVGNRVATASDKGTVIRIFNVSDGSKVYELR